MLDKYLKYAPLSLFGAYFIKALILSVSYPEAAILAVLGATACYFQSKNNDEKLIKLDEKIQASNKILEEKLSLANKNFELRVGEVEGIKSQLNAMKINSLTRPMSASGNQNVR
jgi:hypothetical protein